MPVTATAAEKVAAEIVGAWAGKAITVQGDVSKSADVKRMSDGCNKAFGKLDVLVNNAGVFKFFPLEETRSRNSTASSASMCWAPCSRPRKLCIISGPAGGSVINYQQRREPARIPNASVYSATKGAVDAISRVLGTELGARKIRVNTLAPGGVETEGTHTAGYHRQRF